MRERRCTCTRPLYSLQWNSKLVLSQWSRQEIHHAAQTILLPAKLLANLRSQRLSVRACVCLCVYLMPCHSFALENFFNISAFNFGHCHSQRNETRFSFSFPGIGSKCADFANTNGSMYSNNGIVYYYRPSPLIQATLAIFLPFDEKRKKSSKKK